MPFLRLLESIRTPVLDKLGALATLLGEETVFMVAGLVILWCFSKKWGFRFLMIGVAGTALNQLLKAIFLIPRPWVLDPGFTIVEAAREGASGYSFPSGHTQSAATVFGVLAVWAKRRWVTALCVATVLLVGLSRMYLGVHTPLDVGVSLATGVITVLGMVWLFDRAEARPHGVLLLGAGIAAFAAALLAYVLLAPVREANVASFDADGQKAAWTLFGTCAGLWLALWADARHTHFETRAVWWAQLLKLIAGLALVMAVRVGLKPVLAALFGGALFTHGIRYFVMAVTGGVLWPMTFRLWARLGQKEA
ncbi:MAG: phosphatase PAP2 family protein [Clostridiales bacterium]|nr:phosphatase PAP2 family protein [Clostridiales bacterium]MDO4350404.1 phosphatase PAP2 family protein [Eubacteriales bacterium]MDY4008257.1 phosphatase PAP2 family protein [Candidatus Limiplasma sp.]